MYELEYPTAYGTMESKIVLILYAPDICASKEKFTYATSKDALKKKLPYISKELQVNDWADIDEESFLKNFKHWAREEHAEIRSPDFDRKILILLLKD